jgi:hypothetical protein
LFLGRSPLPLSMSRILAHIFYTAMARVLGRRPCLLVVSQANKNIIFI